MDAETPASPPRHWYQLHLGTALVLLLVTALHAPIVIETIQMWIQDVRKGGVYLDQQHMYAFILICSVVLTLACGAAFEALVRLRKVKPQWFQFHLSTTLIVMCVGAGLVGCAVRQIQTQGYDYIEYTGQNQANLDIYGGGWYEWNCGWPLAHSRFLTGDDFVTKQFKHVHWFGMIVDLALLLLLLGSIAFLCEWHIRRKRT